MGNAEYVGSQLCERFQSAKMSTAAEKSKPKKSTTKTTKKMEQAHPPSSVMIVKAIEDLKEKKGSSLASIKKYIGANYKVDLTKLSVHIRRVNRRQSQKHRRRSKHLQRKRQNHRRKQPQKRQKKQNLSRKQQRRSLFRRKQKKGQPLKRLRRKSS